MEWTEVRHHTLTTSPLLAPPASLWPAPAALCHGCHGSSLLYLAWLVLLPALICMSDACVTFAVSSPLRAVWGCTCSSPCACCKQLEAGVSSTHQHSAATASTRYHTAAFQQRSCARCSAAVANSHPVALTQHECMLACRPRGRLSSALCKHDKPGLRLLCVCIPCRVPFPIGAFSPSGYIDTMYLDADLRVSKGDKGSIFIARRAEKQQQ